MKKEDTNHPEPPEETTHKPWLEQLGSPVAKNKFWSTDKFLSLLAFLISLGTFSTFAYQTYLIQKQQYANSMPYLKLDVNYHRDSSTVTKVQIALLNNGVGPAFIQNTKIHYQDSIYELGLVEFIYSLIPLDSVVYTSTYPLRSGDVVPAGREWVMLQTSDQKLLAIISRLAEEVEFTITYTSIYDEAWQITNEGTPKKLDQPKH